YGGQAEHWPQLVTVDSCAATVGDEPVMIAASTQCPVVVGPDRVKDVEMLLDKHDCNIVLSDDGLQHYRLHRDIEIAVVDARRLMGNGFCLPAGPLREPSRRLKTVDLVIYNGGKQAVSYTLEPGQLVSLADRSVSTLDAFQGQTVHAVAAIGHPQRFFDLLEKQGLHLIKHSFADHYLYQEEDLVFNDDLPILMTEKDAVKCTGFNISNSWYLPVTATLSADAHSQFKQLIKQVCNG
ncbi:MAG: tetraacyldisaccharide 4'-kinase, partial [Gammaproteobacteria bacterium]|nr:tetraacyldisaccharide 4'-kinase [Gammaproteobacteria bacterium]